MLELIKRVLKSTAIGRAIYRPLNLLWKRRIGIPLRRRRLRAHGYEVLAHVHQFLSEKGIPYYCDAGTLLGFIRDKGFIKNDTDIDIAVMPEYVSLSRVLQVFLENGFRYKWGHAYENRFMEFTAQDIKTGLTVDVFQHERDPKDNRYFNEIFLRWYPDRNYPSDRNNSALKFHYVGPTGLKTIVEHGISVSVPTNSEEVLDSEFGPWRVPDPTFKSENTGYTELPGFSVRLTQEEVFESKSMV